MALNPPSCPCRYYISGLLALSIAAKSHEKIARRSKRNEKSRRSGEERIISAQPSEEMRFRSSRQRELGGDQLLRRQYHGLGRGRHDTVPFYRFSAVFAYRFHIIFIFIERDAQTSTHFPHTRHSLSMTWPLFPLI